ncbi:MAG TPA: hypothetical protein VFX05_15060 [Casimicrobiaceae bacterium]|nr:hypothetical protein [Casimicrobiaceae bacterium]
MPRTLPRAPDPWRAHRPDPFEDDDDDERPVGDPDDDEGDDDDDEDDDGIEMI